MASTTTFIDLYKASTTSNTVTGMTNTITTIINSALPVDKRCAYPSKVCTHPRAVKQNKTLHRLCEFHRRKANLNQQRMQQRRRLLRHYSQDTRENNVSMMSNPAASDQIEFLDEFRAPPPLESEFSLEELRVLESMLFDSEEDEEESDLDFDFEFEPS